MQRTRDVTQKAIYDKTQYALRVSANSMYGVMAFRYYNFYSPRYGTSITVSSRWSLNVSAAVINGPGFEAVYDDMGSVMYTIDFTSSNQSLIHSYIKRAISSYVDIVRTDLSEFVTSRSSALHCIDKHLAPI